MAVADDLRTRIESAIGPIASWVEVDYASLTTGASLTTDLVDAVMLVVDEALWNARNTSNGKCRNCGALILENWARVLRREVQPHRMWCSFYVGPLEHHRTGSHKMAIGWANGCSCGKSWRDEDGGCPDAAETWRGPKEARP